MSDPVSTQSTSNEPTGTSSVDDAYELLEFISQLGIAMSAAGQPVSTNSASLRRIAQAYNVEVDVTIVPNLLMIKLGGRESSVLDLASGVNQSLRLDQTADLFNLVRQAELGAISPREGLTQLRDIEKRPGRYSNGIRTIGYAFIALGIGLILEGSLSALVTCALLGLLIGEIKILSKGHRTAEVLLPVVSSLAVGTIVFSIVKADWVAGPMLLLIPPVVTFLPGGILTTAMIELANGDAISGSSRLVAGTTTLLLLVFGYVVAAELIGLPAAEAFASQPNPFFGWWGPWVGVFIYGVGNYFHFTAPRRSLHWLCIVLYVAWIGQQVGSGFLGGYLSGFVGGVAMTLAAFWIQRQPGGPPALVTFLPGFWLLVPGSLGLVGLTQLVAENEQAGLQSFGDMTFSIVAIALGVMVGTALVRPFGDPLGPLPQQTKRNLGLALRKVKVAAHHHPSRANSEAGQESHAVEADPPSPDGR